MTKVTDFTDCVREFSHGMSLSGVRSNTIEIVLPVDVWMKLARTMDERFKGMLAYQAVLYAQGMFMLDGITFKAKRP